MKNSNQTTKNNNDFDEFMKKISGLPDFVYKTIMGVEGTKVNGEVSEKFSLTDDQKTKMLDLISKITFKDISIEDLFFEIEKRLKVNKETAKQITLELLQKEFFLIKDYFPGIEDEILKLSGEVPKVKAKKLSEQFLKREEEMEKIQRQKEEEERIKMEDTIIERPVEDLVKEFPEVGNQQIGSQKAIIIEAMPVPMKPLVKYWMQDYLEKMGHFEHSNIDRVKYVYHDKNTRTMNDEERRQLNLILKSLDEKISLPYSTRMKKIDFSKTEE